MTIAYRRDSIPYAILGQCISKKNPSISQITEMACLFNNVVAVRSVDELKEAKTDYYGK